MEVKSLWKYGLHAAVLIGILVAGLKVINGDEFWGAIHRFNWIYAPVIVALGITYMYVKGWRFAKMLRDHTDVSSGALISGYVSGQPAALLPAGAAARVGILQPLGVPPAQTTAAIAMSSLSDQAFLLIGALVSALWFDSARKPVLILLSVLTLVSIVLGVEASRMWLLSLIERLMGRFKLLSFWTKFLEALKTMGSWKNCILAVANAGVAFLLMMLALHLALLGVGTVVPPLVLLLAFTLPTMLGRLSALPGGVGVTEAGMIGVLNSAPGVDVHEAAAAVMMFRLGTVLVAAIFGGALYWWRQRQAPAKEALA